MSTSSAAAGVVTETLHFTYDATEDVEQQQERLSHFLQVGDQYGTTKVGLC